MYPPEHICREVERIAPHFRLGWAGQDSGPDGELNQGAFALIDLVPARGESATLMSRFEHGPVFGSRFDRLQRVPIWVDTATPEEVFSGAVIPRIKRMTTSLRERLQRAHEEDQARFKSSIKELSGQMGEELYWNAQRSSDGGDDRTADKFIPQSDKDRVTGDWEAPSEPMPVFPEYI